MQTIQYQGLKTTPKETKITHDFLVVENPLQININNEAYTVVMRTPGNDFDLITGLLYAEDIYKNPIPLSFTVIKRENKINSIINVSINKNDLGKGYLNKRTLLSVSSCGICGKKELDDLIVNGEKLENQFNFKSKDISTMLSLMSDYQVNFKKTGGSHAAAIFNKKREFLILREDIGRHNAVDKVIGNLLTTNNLKDANYLIVSGRVSYEIVSKAFIARIPIIIAVSACSSLAVDFAKEFGICLVGFAREKKLTIYAKPKHLII